MAWVLARINFSDVEDEFNNIYNKNQYIPSWSSFNSIVANNNRRIQIVGYLPIMPASVTDFSTVYSCLCNYNDLLSQLNQEYLPVTCDKGVYS